MKKANPKYGDLVFFPNGKDRVETAVLLLGTALELNYDKSVVRAANGGFLVPGLVAEEINGEQKKQGKKAAPKAKFDDSTSEKE